MIESMSRAGLFVNGEKMEKDDRAMEVKHDTVIQVKGEKFFQVNIYS